MDATSASIDQGTFKAQGTLDVNITGLSDPSVSHKLTIAKANLNSSSTPPVTKSIKGTITLSSGTATLDLTAVDEGDLSDVDLTGLRLRAALLLAGANTERITMKPGATNGYNYDNDSNSSLSLGANDPLTIENRDTGNPAPQVAAGAKTLDFASSDADATLQYIMLFG